MTPYNPTYQDELALTRHFVRVLEERLAGRDSIRRANTHPLDWCHLGVLGPSKTTPVALELDEEQPEADSNIQAPAAASAAATKAPAPSASGSRGDKGAGNDEESVVVADKGEDRDALRRPPSALGFELLVEPDADGYFELSVDARFCIFTQHLPTLKEQSGVLGADSLSEGAPIAEVVQRWPVCVKGLRFRLPASGRKTGHDNGKVNESIASALDEAYGRSDIGRCWPGNRPKVEKVDVLKDDQAFQTFLASVCAGAQAIDRAPLSGVVEVRVWPRSDGKARVGCYIRNATHATGIGAQDAYLVMGDAAVTASVVSGALLPIEILPVPADYQYDRRVWAVGHNTSVRVSADRTRIETAALATYEQPRIATRDQPPARFVQLDADPFATLTDIYEQMLAYGEDWEERILKENSLGLTPEALTECANDYAGFRAETQRFASGIAALRADGRLLTAFRAMNRVFGRLAKGYDSWRLFQLVFIVTQLPALAVRESVHQGEFPEGTTRNWSGALDWGDVLWFRTGGGKTEAYLGLTCCAILYDRLRGKNFGMSAWLRFPLRMLSVQQLQRAMRVVWEAEVERKALLGAKAAESEGFRLGYFVGSTTTPNSLSDELMQRYSSEESLKRLLVVPDCPACEGRGTVKVIADRKAVRFRHACTACSAELPLDVSDDEVYRYLPTLVVGTIDKMASVGQQPRYGMLWGGARWKCPEHGYSFGAFCVSYPCKVDKKQRLKVTPYDPAPALHIQDELHLLQEELGAFAGHYETLVRYCEQSLSGLPSKVVAATATIEGFEHQVRHLYGVKDARRFPGRGYDRLKSFYSEPDRDEMGAPKTARVFVAFRSASMHQADAAAFCTEILQTEIDRLARNPHLVLAIVREARSEDDAGLLLRYYTTTLNYVGSLPRGSRVKQALSEAAARTRPDGPRELNVEYHSSRSTGAEVADLVHRVESPPEWLSDQFLDALVATNMISHGVDLERINLMTMDGVPEETAEYIQASSRSGRKHVGLVAVVLPGFSLRATSIYHRFIEFHDHLDRMVSPVPVNRFAKYAAQRTLPGIALGLIYGLHAAKTGNFKLRERFEAAALLNELGAAGLAAELNGAYALGLGVYDKGLEMALQDTLTNGMDTILVSVRNSHEKLVRNAMRPAPMTSLRDVEPGIPFWPDAEDGLLRLTKKTKE